MKLNQISEGFLLQKIRDQLMSSGYFNRPTLQTGSPEYQASSGFDSGSRASGDTSYSVGTPYKPRLRQFLGMTSRPGSIRLG